MSSAPRSAWCPAMGLNGKGNNVPYAYVTKCVTCCMFRVVTCLLFRVLTSFCMCCVFVCCMFPVAHMFHVCLSYSFRWKRNKNTYGRVPLQGGRWHAIAVPYPFGWYQRGVWNGHETWLQRWGMKTSVWNGIWNAMACRDLLQLKSSHPVLEPRFGMETSFGQFPCQDPGFEGIGTRLILPPRGEICGNEEHFMISQTTWFKQH